MGKSKHTESLNLQVGDLLIGFHPTIKPTRFIAYLYQIEPGCTEVFIGNRGARHHFKYVVGYSDLGRTDEYYYLGEIEQMIKLTKGTTKIIKVKKSNT